MAVVGGVLGRAAETGKNRRLADAKKQKVTWENPEEIKSFMKRELRAALTERKAVMGRLQSNVEGFNEEEQNILRSQYAVEDLEVTEDEMLGMLGQAAIGETSSPKKATMRSEDDGFPKELGSTEEFSSLEEIISAEQPSLEGIEEQLAQLMQNTAAIASEIKPSSSTSTSPSVSSIEHQVSGLEQSVAAIEAEIKGAGKQE